ncbi:RepB family protein [Escherichia coli]|nr:RepB family protein [Escherichia coli]
MSQTVNAETSSSGKSDLTEGESCSCERTTKASLARRSATHKAFHAVIQLRLKEKLSELADEDGITQAQMLEWLIESEVKRRKSL